MAPDHVGARRLSRSHPTLISMLDSMLGWGIVITLTGIVHK